jgi:hypothetical protein
MSKYQEIRRRLDVDKHNLDEENVRQPQLILEITRELTFANDERDLRKRELERCYSKLHEFFRDTGQRKPGEDTITQMIRQKNEYQEAQEELAAAIRSVALWEGLLEAARAKGWTLRALGELYLAQYYARESQGSYEDRNKIKELNASRVREEQAKIREAKGWHNDNEQEQLQEAAATRPLGQNKRRSRKVVA